MTTDDLPRGRRAACPFCGLLVIFEDAARTVHHEAPICERFAAMAEEAGGERSETKYAMKSARRTPWG
jgi:hypothetical protein